MEVKKKVLSYSRLSLFEKCPYEYFFKYIIKDQATDISWPGSLYGSTIHKILEEYIIGLNKKISHKKLEKELKGSFEHYFLLEKKELKKPKVFKESKDFRMHKQAFFDNGDRGATTVIKFFNKYFQGYESVEAEKVYQGSWSKTVDTTGIIDVKFKYPDGTIKIVDLKLTAEGSNFWWVDWKNDPQSHMYDFLVYKNLGIIPESFAYMVYDRTLNMLYFKERTEPVNFIETIETENYLGDLMNEVDTFIDTCAINPEYAVTQAKPKEQVCHWCPFKADCIHKWESEIIKQGKKVLKK